MKSLPYICEISQAESYRINEAARDFTYGTTTLDASVVEKGPKIIEEPVSVLIIRGSPTIHIECAAEGNPNPTYYWYKNFGTANQTIVDHSTSDRYTLTNGRLTMEHPKLEFDPGDYQCVIENKFGSILSNPVRIIAGFLSEFSNEPQGTVNGYQYQGTVINCNTPAYNPEVLFSWYKTDTRYFVRPRLNPHMFISRNGKLYFSELQPSDHGQYFCVVTLIAPEGQQMATQQGPMETSLGIGLTVTSENANEYGPLIHNDFPAAFPSPPMRGKDLRLECFAYGKLPMYYTWDREEYGLPANISYDDAKRVMIIHDVKLEDSGSYTCHVKRGETASASKNIFVAIEAEPYFMYPLKDQHLDKGGSVSWRCQAIAVPIATYTWFKNSKPIESIPGDIEVQENVLVIHEADKRHEGMYQCLAKNIHGSSYSNAQLRTLNFKPTFAKHPLKTTVATQGGNLTIVCLPEGAPYPTITWLKDGAQLSVTQGGVGRLMQLPNGYLLINDLTQSDAGVYTCEASNDLGKDSSSARIYVTSRTTLVKTPTNEFVLINNTAFFYCQASYDEARHDLSYVWYFYERRIDLDIEPHYTVGTRDSFHGLYIRYAQYTHQGIYKCVAQTPQDVSSASAYLTVFGPPGEPAGVYAKNINNDRSIDLKWTAGLTHGSAILQYRIEYFNVYDMVWRVYRDNIDITETILTDGPSKYGYTVDNLSPGTRYSFRVTAYNIHGYGEPSLPSKFFAIPAAAPADAVQGVGGGGGSVGELRVHWEKLPIGQHGGPGLHYKVYWRKKDNIYGKWLVSDPPVAGEKEVFITIIEYQYYYTEYEVKVGVVNDLGAGPNTTVVVIFSAEDMPLATPANVNGAELNATAADIFWDPCPDDREHMKGRVLGYQVNYWLEGMTYQDALFSRHLGQADFGRIIGLDENSDYWVNAQVYNTAGLGPKSEDARVSTWASPPFLYPEYVNVTSRDESSINVWWRGISTTILEEALRGYKLRYWESSQNMNTAQEVVVGKVTHAVIPNVERGITYSLRVLGYSYGGDGKKSPTVYFTLGGQLQGVDLYTTEILARGFTTRMSLTLIITSLISTWFL
ncbi:contactin [Patella vulgata]|uniref:contactin n=1 Tax=Patella vulgata TaxID=6465 RepID=UPI0024A897CA|nr:contactin [Patella vulgata]